mgnify:CR=1 FL=1
MAISTAIFNDSLDKSNSFSIDFSYLIFFKYARGVVRNVLAVIKFAPAFIYSLCILRIKLGFVKFADADHIFSHNDTPLLINSDPIAPSSILIGELICLIFLFPMIEYILMS